MRQPQKIIINFNIIVIVYFNNNYYALKTHGIEKFNLNPKYKKIQYFKFSSKPTDLEINGNLYYSTENGEIGTFNKIKKIVNSKIIDFDIEFLFSIGEESGIYINGDMIKTDDDFLTMITKLKSFYEKFKSKWSKVLASRKKTIKSDQ